ncbi:phosphatidate cytidylyltransferase [Candidatus Pelagibacter sp.]|nr:phosphatidate cytidylyltransferase [Candidatus Pelagibacter sp.]
MKNELTKRVLSSIIIIPISIFFVFKGSFLFILFLLLLFLISLYEWFTIAKKTFLKIFGIIFLIFSLYSCYNLREYEISSFLFIIIICVSTDIGGYFFGKFFKGPKLTQISPKKTYSGAAGSFILSILNSFFYLGFFKENNFYNYDFNHYYEVVLLILIISSISQIGDLIISYFKRLSKIKDTGRLFPGHGGLLDRIDGMIFVFPFTYLIYKKDILFLF